MELSKLLTFSKLNLFNNILRLLTTSYPIGAFKKPTAEPTLAFVGMIIFLTLNFSATLEI